MPLNKEQEPIAPDHVLTGKEQARYQALADKAGRVIMVTDARPGLFYPRQGQRTAEKEAGN